MQFLIISSAVLLGIIIIAAIIYVINNSLNYDVRKITIVERKIRNKRTLPIFAASIPGLILMVILISYTSSIKNDLQEQHYEVRSVNVLSRRAVIINDDKQYDCKIVYDELSERWGIPSIKVCRIVKQQTVKFVSGREFGEK